MEASEQSNGKNDGDKDGSRSDNDINEESSTKNGKIRRTLESMQEQMKVTDEEINYRTKMLENADSVRDYFKCTNCNLNFQSSKNRNKTISAHPLLGVLMCDDCCDYYGDGNFSLDSDGDDKYCRWCGEGGTLFECSKCICGFCDKCIKKHFGKDVLTKVENDDDWVCYVCNPKPLWYLRSVCVIAKESAKSKKEQQTKRKRDQNLTESKSRKSSKGKEDNLSEESNDESSSKSSSVISSDFQTKRKRRKVAKHKEKYKRGESSSSDEKPFKKSSKSRNRGSREGSSMSEEIMNPKKRQKMSSPSFNQSKGGKEREEERKENKKEKKMEEERMDFSAKKCLVLEKLRGIWKLTESITEVGLNSSKDRLTKLTNPDYLKTIEDLEKEYNKCRSFLMGLSSTFKIACNSVSSVKLDLSSEKESGKSDLDFTESEFWFDMIKSFVKSKEFKSLFTLKLLADTLYAIVGKYQSQESRASLDETVKDTLEEGSNNGYSALLHLIQPESKKVDSTRDSEEEEATATSNRLSEESFMSNMSSSTVLFNLSESGKDCNSTEAGATSNGNSVNKVSKSKSSKDDDFFEGSDEDKNDTKSAINGKISRNANKQNFFTSDSDASDTSSSDTERLMSTPKKKKKIKKERVSKVNDEKEGVDENEEDETRGLEKLLRMTKLTTTKCKSTTTCSSDDEEKEKEKRSEEKAKEIPKQKKEKMEKEKETLMDYLNLVENTNCDVTSKAESEDENENSNKFLTEFNDEVKNAFLLSSTESEVSEGSGCEDSKKVKPMKKEKKGEGRELRKRRRDDLAKYRISSGSSSEDVVKEEVMSSDTTVSFQDISDDESADESDNNGCGKKSRPSKRLPSIKSEEIVLTDSENSSSSDIEQIPVVKSQDSPTKGRKNIQKIFSKDSLQLATKQALKTETERKKRLSERKKVFDKHFSDSPKLVLDFDPKTQEELVVVEESLSNKLKPHQREGVKFMWDSCFESLERMNEDPGSGCILAHCMGLGKTLQVISLVHTLLTYQTVVKSVMILCPLNTLKNWIQEFKMWLKDTEKSITVCDILSSKTKYQKIERVKLWKRKGGVLVLSYETLRSLLRKGNNTKAFFRSFLDPGPDMVVCDEGHVLKNENSALYKCVSQVKTLRRIILTGTPLQNNLLEYYCMVQFVKPNILGTRKEFMNRFVNPINNGQFEDSTQLDVRVMKRRAHVLHTMLDGFIQRFGYYVLTPFLPEKQEYVISITLTETQKELYRLFIRGATENQYRSEGLFNDFSWLQKVWTHPWVMMQYARKNTEIEDERTDRTIHRPERMKEHWGKLINESDYEDIRSSGKLVLLFGILKKCYEIGDKILVFSQHLTTLNMIEHFLQTMSQSYFSGVDSSSFEETWVLGEDYFRMDGSTSVENRHIYCRKFNNKDNKRSRLFLISTRAGGLGINLVGANRVVIFDASWNPSHDVQSIFRVYRFGQEKPCYIYRFLAEATMEEKIYKRQVNKLSLAHRILDEHQIERHYTMGNLQELYRYEPTPREKWEVPKIPKDNLFAEILVCNQDIIVGYHEHDSLLENKEEEELTEEERRVAWEEFEKEKQPPKLPNGFPVANLELLKTVPMYRPPFDSTFPNQRIFNQSSNKLCKIVEVRTLQGEPESNYPMNQLSDVDMGTLIDIGRMYGVLPYEGEIAHNYRLRLSRSMKTILPWNSPGMTITGNGNEAPSALN